jgi:Carboxypeptidase regulatory-like domain
VNRRAVLVGTLLLAAAPLWAQTGAVRIRVTDPDGRAIPEASVSLANAWDRTVGSASTNNAGEVYRTHLPFGNLYFSASTPGFYTYRAGIAICDGREQTIVVKLAPWPRQGQQFVVYGPGFMVEPFPMPTCENLDLGSPRSKPPSIRKSSVK